MASEYQESFRILIVGGGIAGLATVSLHKYIANQPLTKIFTGNCASQAWAINPDPRAIQSQS